MKISFSTLGCPNWTWGEITSAAKDLGYNGIELRGLGTDIFIPQVKIFDDKNRDLTYEALKQEGLEISCVSSDTRLNDTASDSSVVEDEIRLSSAVGSKYVRILGDYDTQPGKVDMLFLKKRIEKLAGYAEENGVTLLLETNGVFAESKVMKAFVEDISSSALKVLWDINHPVRYFNESVDTTWENIGEHVRHFHVKDSVVENGKISYKMLDYGTLPIREAFAKLKNSGYDGYYSLEWVKRWNNDLEDAGIVFSHYAYMARKIFNEV